jgi:hypothetical protein
MEVREGGREGEGSAVDVKAKERKERRPFRGKGEWVRQRWRERWENGHTLREKEEEEEEKKKKQLKKFSWLMNNVLEFQRKD